MIGDTDSRGCVSLTLHHHHLHAMLCTTRCLSMPPLARVQSSESSGRQIAKTAWMHTPKMRKTFRAAATDA